MKRTCLLLAMLVWGCGIRGYHWASYGPGDTSAGDITHASQPRARVVVPNGGKIPKWQSPLLNSQQVQVTDTAKPASLDVLSAASNSSPGRDNYGEPISADQNLADATNPLPSQNLTDGQKPSMASELNSHLNTPAGSRYIDVVRITLGQTGSATEAGESKFVLSGTTTQSSWRMLDAGPVKGTQYIASTMMGITNPETSNGLLRQNKPQTGAIPGSKEGADTGCPVERGQVKLLFDPKAEEVFKATASDSTLNALVRLKPPTRAELIQAGNTRLPLELSIKHVKIQAMVVGHKKETDSDIHIVLADPAAPTVTMIAEIPSPDCVPINYRDYFAVLQAHFTTDFGRPKATFTKLATPVHIIADGIFFFDYLHGQTGVALNGAELHPLLDWKKQ